MEKLSSGFRINRAGDDAAGLSISEKMRGQIRGLNQASANSQDGISMIQTAEGALNETQAILQRMRELAVQSGNDTNVDELDREAIQNEFTKLKEEIDRIGNTTEFNTQKLLNGGGEDPSKIASTSQLLDIPANLEGGQTGGTAATSTFTIADLSSVANKDALDGKEVTFKLGEKEITLTFNKNLSASNETQIGIKDINSADTSAKAIRDALTAAIAKDDDLKDQYTVSGATTAVTVTASALAFQNDGTFKGVDHADGNIEFSSTDATINGAVTEAATKGVGSRASTTIDFTGKTAEELVGEGIYVDGKKIDFYDSSNGAYKGDADFSVDLKGAGNAEAIVDKVVKALHDGAGASKLTNVYATKTEDSKLKITAQTAGIAGNSIQLEDNFAKDISNVKGTDKITGEEVTSANGLKDGTHTVEITHNVAKATEVAANGFTGVTFDIPSETTMDSGTYKVVGTASGEAKLQKMGADGTFADVTGEAVTGIAANGSLSFGDITISSTHVIDISGLDLTFTIEESHYSATLTEQDGTKGEAVKINSNDVNVELKAQDGSGSATINVGKIEDSLAIGASTKFTFETATPVESQESIVGGTFEAKFQIGANEGQTMEIGVKDMRAQALGINGVDLSTGESAEAGITTINDAINKVSAQRSELGAFQNRLEHTIKNLDNSAENLQAAEARIRDVDMAKEMMEQTKQNILAQASTAMLAQANASPEAVLQLLR